MAENTPNPEPRPASARPHTSSPAQPDAHTHPDALAEPFTEPADAAGTVAEVVEEIQAKAPRTAKDYLIKVLQVVASFAVVGFILGWLVPFVGQTTWPEILGNIQRIGWGEFAYLFVLMFVGLYLYTYTLSASLPGLSHRQALMVNLSGSGVSNAIPGGGAMGTAATYAIFRSWGFSHKNIGTSLIITSIFNMLLRLLLPLIALVWLLAAGSKLPDNALIAAGGAAALGAVIAALLIAILASENAAHRIGKVINGMVAGVKRLFKKEHTADVEAIAVDMRKRILSIVRVKWPHLIFGILGFLLVHAWMFHECLRVMGVQLPLAEVFCGYAISRVSTVVAVTPGGIGVTEAAPLAALIAFGAPGPEVTAGLILYALFSHILEIPLGMIAGAFWVWTRKHFYKKQEEDPTASGPESLPAFH